MKKILKTKAAVITAPTLTSRLVILSPEHSKMSPPPVRPKLQYWQKQLANRITTVEQLDKKIRLTDKEREDLLSMTARFRMGITPYYLSLIDKNNPDCPIRKQAIPTINELNVREEELPDPLGDERRSPIKGITHRYPDRLLLYPTYQCAMYCRHCFRRRIVGQSDKTLTSEEMDKAIAYIQEHTEVREVILSGGDPLFLPDEMLKSLLSRIKNIPHVRWIRIHSRVFVTLPYRITPTLARILKSVRPLSIITHVNHPNEITPQFKRAVDRILCSGIPMFDQSVLLKGINDNHETLQELFYRLMESGVKPYYLHQCDLAQGVSHFRTSVQTGINLMKGLRGFISGLCIPTYMIDTPGGYGKVPINYDYIKSYENKMIQLETFKGEVRPYIEP